MNLILFCVCVCEVCVYFLKNICASVKRSVCSGSRLVFAVFEAIIKCWWCLIHSFQFGEIQ